MVPYDLNPLVHWPYFAAGAGIILLLWAADQLFAPISTLPYGIILFCGNRGRGKTFTAVTYARRWRHNHPNSAVYTNLSKLEVPGKGPVYRDCTLDQIMHARDALIVLDEAGVEINAWNFVAENQRKFARWVAATRHMRCMTLMTAHSPSHINKRIRDVTDELYYMESFQGLGVFRAKVYESVGGEKAAKPTKTVWIPKWPSTCKSYDTNSLRTKSDAAGVDIVGPEDTPMPGFLSDGNSSPDTDTQTTITTIASALREKRERKKAETMARFAMPAVAEEKEDHATVPADSHSGHDHTRDSRCALPRVAARYDARTQTEAETPAEAPRPAKPEKRKDIIRRLIRSHSDSELREFLETGA